MEDIIDTKKETVKKILFVFVIIIFLGFLFYLITFVDSGLKLNVGMGHITISKVECSPLNHQIMTKGINKPAASFFA